MNNSGRGADHFDFIQRTDRKSLHTQIGLLVAKAKQVSAEELQERSQRLKKMLDEEHKRYEEEFSNTVKTRMNERKEHVNAIQEQVAKQQKKFLEEKHLQRMMLDCYEIRQAMRHQDLIETKIIQEEQILENQRKKRRECQLEQEWLELNRRRWAQYDCNQADEDLKRQQVQEQVKHVLGIQVAEHEEKRKEALAEKLEEERVINALLEEIRLEEFDKEHQPAPVDQLAYQAELLKEIQRKHCARLAEWEADKAEHRAFCLETQRLEAEAYERIAQSKKDLNRATLEYLAYLRRMQSLELGIEKMMDERTADLFQLDVCTKVNIKERIRLKREEADKCYEILRKQICEDYERRLVWDAELRENKMPENRFVHPEVTHEMIMCRKLRYKADLDAQIAEMKRIQAEEEKKFDSRLMAAIDDPVVCKKMAKEILDSGIDYLAPHPNWRVLACNPIQYIPRAPTTEQEFNARVAAASLDKCHCPKAAEKHCGFMADVGGWDVPPEGPKPKAKKGAIEALPMTQKPGFRNCHCKFG
ncbi:cilia- and flagella-associated protein 53 [Drosophila kikkawai]|uniref:Cilia- and flagella-associated protein 53 n=1 Tax=Drosophila kikkawai TaxID=30033 RepID=A0A6P4J747_DROKI|nr:trichohyalin [Drosophila kikkawai]